MNKVNGEMYIVGIDIFTINVFQLNYRFEKFRNMLGKKFPMPRSSGCDNRMP